MFRDTWRCFEDVEAHISNTEEPMFRNVGTHDPGELESTFWRRMKTHVLDTWEPTTHDSKKITHYFLLSLFFKKKEKEKGKRKTSVLRWLTDHPLGWSASHIWGHRPPPETTPRVVATTPGFFELCKLSFFFLNFFL